MILFIGHYNRHLMTSTWLLGFLLQDVLLFHLVVQALTSLICGINSICKQQVFFRRFKGRINKLTLTWSKCSCLCFNFDEIHFVNEWRRKLDKKVHILFKKLLIINDNSENILLWKNGKKILLKKVYVAIYIYTYKMYCNVPSRLSP